MNVSTLYTNCYEILTTYMLYSAIEPSYNLSKNLLLLPWILKLIVDMVNDSTPLLKCKLLVDKPFTKQLFFEPDCLSNKLIKSNGFMFKKLFIQIEMHL